MVGYFKKDKNDEAFYEKYLAGRLPERIIDAHIHMYLPEHVKNVSAEAIAGDWAAQCANDMSYEEAEYYFSVFLPETKVGYLALPSAQYEADSLAVNDYIASLVRNKGIMGAYTLRPEYDAAEMENKFLKGGFSGFKPYPYFACKIKGADISIFDFLTHEHLKLANKLKTAVVLHLPRAGRFADKDNIKEIKEIVDRYPDIKLVIAHFGRSFYHEFLTSALDQLGGYANKLYYDTAAVINPKTYAVAFDRIDYKRIIFGTDLPVFLWHGKREYINGDYKNLCREDFPWNDHKYPEKEADYTFFLYEQFKAILDIIGNDKKMLESVFYKNAIDVFGK